MGKRKGRGRLNSIELLPPECGPIITWAAEELRSPTRTQQDIYEEFYTRLGNLMADSRGEIEFQIPSKSAFNRFSIKLAILTRRLDETREIASTLADSFDAGASDDLTLMSATLVKVTAFHMLGDAIEKSMAPKEVMQLASALKSALQAEAVSTLRRQKVEKDVASKVSQVVESVGKARGFSAATREEIIAEIMGVVRK